jgi:hypothetical protein
MEGVRESMTDKNMARQVDELIERIEDLEDLTDKLMSLVLKLIEDKLKERKDAG